MTREQLKACLPYASEKNIDKFLIPLNNTFIQFEINTAKRQAAFLAQLAHESGSLRYMQEIADGRAYDLRKDLGNTKKEAIEAAAGSGLSVGSYFKGHGPIQITGYDNHLKCSMELFGDNRLIKNPLLLTNPLEGSLSAGWFWKVKGLNELADDGNFKKISIKINGVNRKTGLPNGYDDRVKHYNICKKAFGIKEIDYV